MTSARDLRAFVAELAAAGVADAIVCPGSRSTPLALALRANPAIRVRVLLDERGAGFFALGLAKASRRPVAVCVTSGTAAANLLPAAVEANLARVPLILLTADRPAELRDRGAPQTIDQVGLFGSHVKWTAELPLPDGSAEALAHLRSIAGRAVATAVEGPTGPVHLNAPFREPLVPDGSLAPEAGERAHATLVPGIRTLAADALAGLAERLRGSPRGLIVVGPQDDPALPAALARLAGSAGFPILADPLSLARCGPHDRSRVLARGDFLLRPGPWLDGHRPDLVVRFGAMPTSKPFLQMLEAVRPELVVVDGDGGWREPALVPATFVRADATWLALALADALREPVEPALPPAPPPAPALAPVPAVAAPSRAIDLEITQPRTVPPASSEFVGPAPAPPAPTPAPPLRAPDPSWLRAWIAADRAADQALRGWLATLEARGELFEGAVFAHLGDLLPPGAVLWAGSSMPVRDMDSWLPAVGRAIRPLANRGANGIDGVISSALGAAAAVAGHVTLVIGDVSFLHDLTALVMARLQHLAITIVVVNNDGGGIFSFLPQATTEAPEVGLPAHFEELFGTPHRTEIGPLVAALGGTHRRAEPRELRAALAAAITARGLAVLEVRTERTRNAALHREAADVAARAIALVREPAP
jgi:2-succinyl-5-enolpyruvyl-6-hydroxy-3-cyclohexene-1-carboxylate synthase